MSLPKKRWMHYTVRCIPVMVMGVTLGLLSLGSALPAILEP